MSEALLRHIGFDFSRGQRGQAPHPFTVACGDDDVRIATRTDESRLQTGVADNLARRWSRAFRSAFVESAPSERALRRMSKRQHCTKRTRVCLENAFGRSAEFWYGARELMPRGFDLEAWIKMLRAPAPWAVTFSGRCRELSPPHRFTLRARSRAHFWRAGRRRFARRVAALSERALVEILPAHDNEGCLQDNHWPSGMFGYFACYSVGEAIAFQLSEAMQPSDALSRGDFHSNT